MIFGLRICHKDIPPLKLKIEKLVAIEEHFLHAPVTFDQLYEILYVQVASKLASALAIHKFKVLFTLFAAFLQSFGRAFANTAHEGFK